MSNSKLCRLPEVINRTGLSRSAVYDLISKDKFPSQVNLGPRTVGWVENEITDWIDARIEESRRHGRFTARPG
ncbi:MAG: AlpA family transcriptional regulator [Proteobacteria bacterium]|nr:AlpA family transcriptional regulator [Pseudomonadota bacterium]